MTMKQARIFLVLLFVSLARSASSLPIEKVAKFFVAPQATPFVSCGGFASVNFSSSSADGATTNTPIDTTAANLYVVTVGSSLESGTPGTITPGSIPPVTFIAGNLVQSGTPGFFSQQFYCIGGTTDAAMKFYAVGSGGGRVGCVAQVFSCTGTPIFKGQTGNGATSGITLQTGSLTPSGTNLFVSSCTIDVVNSGNYTAPTLLNLTLGSDSVPAEGWTNSASALNVTWTNETSAAKAVSVMMFGSTGCSSALNYSNYTTVFAGADQNPLSESGAWIGGLTTGLDWHDCVTSNHIAFGPLGDGVSDSTAVLSFPWSFNQVVTATVYMGADLGPGVSPEAEILLRFTTSANNNSGYECLFSTKQIGNYISLVKWNGAVGDYDDLYDNPSPPLISNGDTLKAQVIGAHIQAWVNSTLVIDFWDSSIQSGSPGMGLDGGGLAPLLNYDVGFSAFSAQATNTPTTGDRPSVVIEGIGSIGGSFDGSSGNKFSIASTITVTQLGMFVFSGCTKTTSIGMWNSSGTLLGNVSLNQTGLSTGWHYVPLGSPLTMTSGTYVVGMQNFTTGEQTYNDDADTVFATGITSIGSVYSSGSGFSFPDTLNTSGNRLFGPAGFIFH